MDNNQQPLNSQQPDKTHKPLTLSEPLKIFIFLILVLSLVGFSIASYKLGIGKNQTALQNNSVTISPTIIQPSSTPTHLIIPTIDPSVTANWKIYRNEEFGFEVKHPKEWEEILQKPELPLQKFGALFASPDKIDTFSSKASIWIKPLEVAIGEEGKTKEGRDKYLQGLQQLPGKKSTVFFGKYPAIEILLSLSKQDLARLKVAQLKGSNVSGEILVYEPTNAFYAELDINNYTEGAELMYLPVFHQILSTFKFTQ